MPLVDFAVLRAAFDASGSSCAGLEGEGQRGFHVTKGLAALCLASMSRNQQQPRYTRACLSRQNCARTTPHWRKPPQNQQQPEKTSAMLRQHTHHSFNRSRREQGVHGRILV